MNSSIGLYAKAIAAGLGAAGTAAITGLQDGNIAGWEWATVIGALLVGFAGVALADNTDVGVRRYLKAIVAGLVAAAGFLATALLDNGISQTEWVGLALAILTALQVAFSPNSFVSDEFRGSAGVQQVR